jgi:hypothetical protein
VFALLVPSCCDKSGTNCYNLVTLLQGHDGDRLATSCSDKTNIQTVRNKLLRACWHQLVTNLSRADDVGLIGTTAVINVVTRLIIYIQ